jgi:hypothetical protein
MPYSTNTIFGRRALNQVCADDYVEWAVEQLVLGHDSFHLRILAGLDRLGGVLETEEYFLRSIKELRIVEPKPDVAVRSYACEIARQIINGGLTPQQGVRTLYQIWRGSEYSHEFVRWLELDDALDSLSWNEFPYTYPTATQETFDAIVNQEAKNLIAEMEKAGLHELAPH